MIEAALLTILEGDSTLTNIVDDRIYLNVIPQYNADDTTTNSPAIVIVRNGTSFDDAQCDTEEPLVELTLILIADSFTQLASIANACFALLRSTYSGHGTTEIIAGGVAYAIDHIQLTDYRTEWTAQIEGNSKGLFRGLIELSIRYN